MPLSNLEIRICNMRLLSIVATLCILILLVHNICYANPFVITETEINVKCSHSFSEAQPQVYPGIPGTYFELITKGIKKKVNGQEAFIENANLDDEDVLVIARCITSIGDTSAIADMYLRFGENPTPPSLRCSFGEGVSVTMYKPNDEDPDKYQYMATLVKANRTTNRTDKRGRHDPTKEVLLSFKSSLHL